MDLLAFLRDSPPFDQLTEAELAAIAPAFELVRFSRGTRILREGGAPSEYLYLVWQGEVGLTADGQLRQVLEQGDIFGYPSMLGQDAPVFDVTAAGDVIAYRLPEPHFRTLLDNAAFARYFIGSLGERLRTAFEHGRSVSGETMAMPVKYVANLTPLFVPPDTTVQQTARAMREANATSALIRGEPRGIVTDRDLRNRVLAEGLPVETPVRTVMSTPLRTLDSDMPVFGAMTVMLEEGIHHLALVEEGEVVGIVSATDLFRQQARGPLYLQQKLEQAADEEALAGYADDVTAAVDTMARSGLDAVQIGRIISSLNDTLVARLVRLAEARLGAPPVPYAWLVFGSEGRSEQMLLTDQDNALVYAQDGPGVQEYFAALTEDVVAGLLQAGFPPCPGGYMATNWCKSLNEWIRTFSGWIDQPVPAALMEAGIFFDFRPVHGALSLEPLEEILTSAQKNGLFVAHMVRAAQEFNPPLGFFNRIRSEDGRIDIKHGGIAPIVGLARACSLAAGSRERSTLERLVVAADAGTMSRQGAENLAETFQFLLRLRLQQQLADIRAGKAPTNHLRLKELSSLEQRHLKDALVMIRQMQDGVGASFNTGAMR
jgi:CBS domain-containing protein